MCDIYFNFNLILYVVMRSRSYIGMLDCAILRNKYYYYYYKITSKACKKTYLNKTFIWESFLSDFLPILIDKT